jgi:hypothetical protein
VPNVGNVAILRKDRDVRSRLRIELRKDRHTVLWQEHLGGLVETTSPSSTSITSAGFVSADGFKAAPNKVVTVMVVLAALRFVEDLFIADVSTSRSIVTGLVTTEADFLCRL